MRAIMVKEAGGDFELQEREVPEPGFGEALVILSTVTNADAVAAVVGVA